LQHFPKNIPLVFRGISGIGIGVLVAHKTGRKFAIVRKEHESSHGYRVEGHISTKYIIVDDFISRGETIKEIRSVMSNHASNCAGVILYKKRCSDRGTEEELKKEGIKCF
jgi:adenine/guanine phosphoribosyltransferase-like PRPP-binding protein